VGECRVYVGSIPYGLTEEDIRVPFGTFGKILRIDMPREPGTLRSKGFCFVEYEDSKAAQQALQTMNGFELHGRKIKVGRPTSGGSSSSGSAQAGSLQQRMLMNPLFLQQQAIMSGVDPNLATLLQAQQQSSVSARRTRIYVGSIYFNLTQEHVQQVFEAFGKITSCQLIPNPETGLHKGYGFIEYEEEKSAQEAIDSMNGFELCGRAIKVGWASNQTTAIIPPPSLIPTPAAASLPTISNISKNSTPTLPGASSVAGSSLASKPIEGTANAARVELMGRLRLLRAGASSRCIKLTNLVDPSEAAGDQDLADEVREECERIAPVDRVVIKMDRTAGAVIFVIFRDVEGGQKALMKLNGRWFGGREIRAEFYSATRADAGDFAT